MIRSQRRRGRGIRGWLAREALSPIADCCISIDGRRPTDPPANPSYPLRHAVRSGAHERERNANIANLALQGPYRAMAMFRLVYSLNSLGGF